MIERGIKVIPVELYRAWSDGVEPTIEPVSVGEEGEGEVNELSVVLLTVDVVKLEGIAATRGETAGIVGNDEVVVFEIDTVLEDAGADGV